MGGTIIPSSIYGTGTTMKIVLDQKIVEEANEKYRTSDNSFHPPPTRSGDRGSGF